MKFSITWLLPFYFHFGMLLCHSRGEFVTSCCFVFMQDALFTGNLMGTREFKECGADLTSYVHSVSSLHQTTADEKTNKHIARLHSVFGLITEMFDFTLLKSPTFILVCLSGVFVFTGWLCYTVYLTNFISQCLHSS